MQGIIGGVSAPFSRCSPPWRRMCNDRVVVGGGSGSRFNKTLEPAEEEDFETMGITAMSDQRIGLL